MYSGEKHGQKKFRKLGRYFCVQQCDIPVEKYFGKYN